MNDNRPSEPIAFLRDNIAGLLILAGVTACVLAGYLTLQERAGNGELFKLHRPEARP